MGVEQPAFESLTKYLSKLNTDTLGTWIIDRENDGTPEHPIQMPFVDYSDMVHRFIDVVYEYVETCKDLELNRYGEILERNGLEWGESMSAADVSTLDAQCVMALIVGAVRAERFCDGVLLGFFRDGSIQKWLTRLKEIDGGTV